MGGCKGASPPRRNCVMDGGIGDVRKVLVFDRCGMVSESHAVLSVNRNREHGVEVVERERRPD